MSSLLRRTLVTTAAAAALFHGSPAHAAPLLAEGGPSTPVASVAAPAVPLPTPSTASAPDAPPSPAPSGAPGPTAIGPVSPPALPVAPSQARAVEMQRFDVGTFYTHGAYSSGGQSDALAVYVQYLVNARAKVWAGHNQIHYADTAAYANGTNQSIDNAGALLPLGRDSAVQLDYFLVRNDPGGTGFVAGADFYRTFTPELTGSLGFAASQYPGFPGVTQVTPRLIYTPIAALSLQSKLYLTHASGLNTRVALQEKLIWQVGRDVRLQLGGAVGSAWTLMDNDISALYTQPQPLTGQLFANVEVTATRNLKAVLHFERASFQGYHINYILGGLKLQF